jgi:signal transduction histidine kinase
MSHEIRTPIGAILGFSEVLLNDESMTETEKKEYLRIIHRNAHSLSRLLNDVLDLSKIEMGRMEIERVPVQLRPLVEDIISLLQIKAREKGLMMRLYFEDAVPPAILTDPTRLRQILINIVGNAIKFTEQGEVAVRQKILHSAHGPLLAFEISDTGIGLIEEQKKKLFQPFSQADSSTTRKYGGTGLGLDISKRLAQALGGDVVLVESTPNQGSKFLVTLGLQPADPSNYIASGG